MGRRRRRWDDEGCRSREIPSDMLQEILVKLPTKDVARSCCVSRLWRSVAGDPSFRNLHAANHVAHVGDTEALLVSVNSVPGQIDEASVFNMSSGKEMCSFSIPSNYGLANVCNGLLCFMYKLADAEGSAPAIVCNPVTGERLTLPKPPRLDGKIHMFALGFSPPTKEYKLFCLSYPLYSDSSEACVDVHVYTLGDTSGWRQHSFLSPSRPIDVAPPVLIDGRLYVMTIGWRHNQQHEIATKILVIDVSTETYCTCHLPDYDTYRYRKPLVGIYELRGRLCFLAHVFNPKSHSVHFWVMSPPHFDDNKPTHWDPLYRFNVDTFHLFKPWVAWFESDKMLSYIYSNTLHKFDMTGRSTESAVDHDQLLQFNQQLELPATSPNCQWNIYGGFRPTLLSPLAFALPPSQDTDDEHESRHQSEHTLLGLLR